MLLVRAWVGPSKIHGLGLIAHEFIPKGTVSWKLVPGFDAILSEEEVKDLPQSAQEQVKYYGFFHASFKKYILCADDDRFTNHSEEPNQKFYGDYSIAIRDIDSGEELTDNYGDYGYSMHITSRPSLAEI